MFQPQSEKACLKIFCPLERFFPVFHTRLLFPAFPLEMTTPITKHTKMAIVQHLRRGESLQTVANALHLAKSTVAKYRQLLCPDLPNHPHGRPRSLPERVERQIVQQVLSGKVWSAPKAADAVWHDFQIRVSDRTMRNVLHRRGLRSYRRPRKPLLAPRHRRARKNFAFKVLHWTVDDWKKVVFVDESKFERVHPAGPLKSWRWPGVCLRSEDVRLTLKFGGGSVMIWGRLSWHGLTPLVRIQGPMNASLYLSILQENLAPFVESFSNAERQGVMLGQDNDPKHTARRIQSWLAASGIKALKWPANSPDLNPVEHLWAELERRVRAEIPAPTTVDALWSALAVAWAEIPHETVSKLVESMPARIEAVYRARGSYTAW